MIKNKSLFYYLCTLVIIGVSCTSPPPTQVIPSPTQTTIGVVPTQTPLPVCTPPPCKADEAYHCPDECPGGCGTACATYTPESLSEEPTETDQKPAEISTVQRFPDPSQYSWTQVATGLDQPLGLTFPDDGSERLFILEQPGRIRILQDSQVLSTPFLDIRDRVVDRANEQGLLGLAFHPNYAQNGLFFVNYTGARGDTFISRFQVTADPHIADPASETVLLEIEQPFGNHNGGHLLFGPDGYLYIGTGDGGSGGDPQGNAQNLNSLLGKMLRIDVNQGDLYGIPANNPYVNSGSGRPEIWASGLRNPWRYSFDRATGDLYIADVGQNQWEEINYLASESGNLLVGGFNFGWDYWEATHPFEGTPPQGTPMIAPIWEYDHSKGCSVTGGIVYRGSIPEWQGIFVYGDYCSGTIWGLLQDPQDGWRNQVLFETDATITSFGEDQTGEIYLIDRAGSVFNLVKSP